MPIPTALSPGIRQMGWRCRHWRAIGREPRHDRPQDFEAGQQRSWPASGSLRRDGSRTRPRAAYNVGNMLPRADDAHLSGDHREVAGTVAEGAGPSAIGEGWLSIRIWAVAVYCGSLPSARSVVAAVPSAVTTRISMPPPQEQQHVAQGDRPSGLRTMSAGRLLYDVRKHILHRSPPSSTSRGAGIGTRGSRHCGLNRK